MPGAKQVFRDGERDVIARSGECGSGEALLRPVILGGQLVEPLPGLEQARARAARIAGAAGPGAVRIGTGRAAHVIYSRELRELMERTEQNLMGN